MARSGGAKVGWIFGSPCNTLPTALTGCAFGACQLSSVVSPVRDRIIVVACTWSSITLSLGAGVFKEVLLSVAERVLAKYKSLHFSTWSINQPNQDLPRNTSKHVEILTEER